MNKKILFLLWITSLILIFISQKTIWAQPCEQTGTSGSIRNAPVFSTDCEGEPIIKRITSCSNAGQTVSIFDTVSGETYCFTAKGGASNYLTIYDRGVPIASGPSPVCVTTEETSRGETDLYLQISLNDGACGIDLDCHETFVSCQSCPANNESSVTISEELPYCRTDINTADYSNDYDILGGCMIGTFFYGYDYFIKYTPTTGVAININVTNISKNRAGIFILDDCPENDYNCLASATNDFSRDDLNISEIGLEKGQTYYILVSTQYPNSSTLFDLCITANSCDLTQVNAIAVCTTPNAFSLDVSFMGSDPDGSYTITDNLGNSLPGQNATGLESTISFGNYILSHLPITVYVENLGIEGCKDSILISNALGCNNYSECNLEVVEAIKVCTSQDNFTVDLVFTGTDPDGAYTIYDSYGNRLAGYNATGEADTLNTGWFYNKRFYNKIEQVEIYIEGLNTDCSLIVSGGDFSCATVCNLPTSSREEAVRAVGGQGQINNCTTEVNLTAFAEPGDCAVINISRPNNSIAEFTVSGIDTSGVILSYYYNSFYGNWPNTDTIVYFDANHPFSVNVVGFLPSSEFMHVSWRILPGCSSDNMGCLDPCDLNYDADATINDSSLCVGHSIICDIDGCTNGGIYAWDTSSCSCQLIASTIIGCTDATASNYNNNANCDDNSCMYLNTQPAIEWERNYGGSGGDGALSIQQTTDGGYIVAGGPNILKLDESGNLEWFYPFGAVGYSIIQTIDGGYIVAGSSNRTFDYLVPSGNDLILKLDGQGNLEWEKSYGNEQDNWARSIQQTNDGGYIIAGSSYLDGGMPECINFGYYACDSWFIPGQYDFWIIKIDESGNLEWEKFYGDTHSELATSIQQTVDGGYIVAGESRKKRTFEEELVGFYGSWIIKLDELGNLEWEKDFETSISQRNDYYIQQTIDSNYILIGPKSVFSGDNTYANDYWIAKLDELGNLIWERTYGGSRQDDAHSFQQTTDGGYIIAGFANSNDGDLDQNYGISDYWIIKLDEIGNLIWEKNYGGSGSDYAYSIDLTADGGYIIAGSSSSNDGDVGGNNGSADVWIVKLTGSSMPPAAGSFECRD